MGDMGTYIPILKLGQCMFVTVPTELSDTQAHGLEEAISQRLAAERGIRGLVIDVSALAIVDSFVAKILGDAASIAHSFGARAVLVGIRPGVAVTLVELGIDLRSVDTALSLERALEKLKLKIVAVT